MEFDLNLQTPVLHRHEIDDCLLKAAYSKRRRHPKILHSSGDTLNRVVNFILHDSYMQPHLHPGPEKIEKIHLLEGKMGVLFFDNVGAVVEVTILDRGQVEIIAVPAFTWHTYVTLTAHAITYETMMGAYAPETWKEFAQWAPAENLPESAAYLQSLKDAVKD